MGLSFWVLLDPLGLVGPIHLGVVWTIGLIWAAGLVGPIHLSRVGPIEPSGRIPDPGSFNHLARSVLI